MITLWPCADQSRSCLRLMTDRAHHWTFFQRLWMSHLFTFFTSSARWSGSDFMIWSNSANWARWEEQNQSWEQQQRTKTFGTCLSSTTCGTLNDLSLHVCLLTEEDFSQHRIISTVFPSTVRLWCSTSVSFTIYLCCYVLWLALHIYVVT